MINTARTGFSRAKWSVLLVAFALGASNCLAPEDQPAPPASAITSPTITTDSTMGAAVTPAAEVVAEVVSVTDGDTIIVVMPDGTNEAVRLIGIDAPEDGLLLDQEATDYMTDLVFGKKVRMVTDVSDRDRFNRLLRYIYVGDLFVNEAMVRAGLAVARRYRPDIAMAEVLEAAQAGAERGSLGLFSSEGASVTTLAPSTDRSNRGNCHSSYPDACIPPPPPDLDCGDIGVEGFTVLPPDPHGLDGNRNGVGCA